MPGKLIQAYRNSAYGPPLVTQKYSPLSNISFDEVDETFCSRMLRNRWKELRDRGLIPKPLALVVPNWADMVRDEAGKKPPLVVISTNRSKWIKQGVEAAAAQPPELRTYPATEEDPALRTYVNAGDLRALTAERKQKVSPPVYCPSRIGDAGPRNVYVVVHTAEYQTYRDNLADTGINVVGWTFQSPAGVKLYLTGFGASRFAAIEFCKALRAAATTEPEGDEEEGEAPWDYAWLLDDNVVALTSFAGYAAVEAAMDGAEETHVCAGFRGGSSAEDFTKIKKWAEKELEAGKIDPTRGKQAAALPPPEKEPGILQQVVLWNIAHLAKHNLNFGPVFIASGEDVSMGNYFIRKKTPFFFYGGIGVFKENPTDDNSPGSKTLKKAREGMTALFATMEGANPAPEPAPGTQPPPLKFKPLVNPRDEVVFDRGEQPLANFVVNVVLPNASVVIRPLAGVAATQNTAKCQAVEQITCAAIKLKLVGDDALNETFSDAAQEVRQVDRP
jgi:hypothetical protein